MEVEKTSKIILATESRIINCHGVGSPHFVLRSVEPGFSWTPGCGRAGYVVQSITANERR